MLPDIHLDQITFEEMMEKAKNRIAGCYPEWTDFNYHDPGITLVELFAWFKEIQQYEINHIGDAHKRKYIHLLGADIPHEKSAETFVGVKTKEAVLIQTGSRLEAPGVPFETMEPQMLPGVEITHCFGMADKRVSYLAKEYLDLGHGLEFYPFGREALAGSSLYIGFSGPLPVGQPLCLTLLAGGRQEMPRNPASPDTIPLAKMTYTFWNGSCYRPLEMLEDNTFGFLFDGQLKFQVPEEMKERLVDQEKGYYLRIQLVESQYEMPPFLRYLDINTLKVRQRETVTAWIPAGKLSGEEKNSGDEKIGGKEKLLTVSHALCGDGDVRLFVREKELYRELIPQKLIWEEEKQRLYLGVEVPEDTFETADFWVQVSAREDWYNRHRVLGIGRGFPGESYSLDETFVDSSDLELLVEEPERPGIYRKWEQRRDFSGSGPEDAHYCVDCATGTVSFGDCIHGMAPEGTILLVHYGRVLGSGGNVKAHKIYRFTEERLKNLPVTNFHDAAGGRDEESVSEAFLRVREQLAQTGNMVTTDDYEQAVRKTPGLIVESCRALAGVVQADGFGEGQEIQIVVKPGSLEKRPRLKPAYIENIKNYLEPRRMLGVKLKVLSPVYIRLSVYLEVTVYSQYQGAQDRVTRAVQEYLNPFLRKFGENISYSGLYGHIDRLECVQGVRSLVLDARGNGVSKNAYGDLVFPGNGIADEIEIQCSCYVET